MSANDELMLIDLSGIAHQIWHVSGNHPDPNHVSIDTIARVRALSSSHGHAAVCCDSGKSFRADIDPAYKANRDTENRAPLRHQMALACETLKRDGFVIWSALGFEADDLIATATANAMKIDGATVKIVSDDKDLLALVSDRVTVHRLTSGVNMGPADVFDKMGVRPEQVPDLLALMGDKSDNIKGCEKIGGTIGARLLNEHGTLEKLYDAMAHGVVAGVTANMRTNLLEFRERWPVVRQLIALRTDAPIEFSDIAAERVAPPMEAEVGFMEGESEHREDEREPFKRGADSNDAPLPPEMRELDQNESLAALAASPTEERIIEALKVGAQAGRAAERAGTGPVGRVVAEQPAPVYAGPVEFSQQLEPRNMDEAIKLSQRMYDSRLFSAYGTPQAVLATVLAGRELGIPAMASLRAFHIIEGKPQMSAGTIQSLVLKSGKAKTFRCTERTAMKATFVTQRGDDPEMSLTYTIEEGRAAWPKDENAWNKSGWGRNPADMLVARASSKLARLVYPDVVSGLYAPEELD